MESTSAFLTTLHSASTTPEVLKKDIGYILLVLGADVGDVLEVTNAVQVVESIKRSKDQSFVLFSIVLCVGCRLYSCFILCFFVLNVKCLISKNTNQQPMTLTCDTLGLKLFP